MMKYFVKFSCILSLALIFTSAFLSADAYAYDINTYDCYDKKYNTAKSKDNPEDNDDIKATKSKFLKLKQELDKLCKEADDNHWDWFYTSQKNLEDNLKADGKWQDYQTKLKQLEALYKPISELKASKNMCGEDYPYGCPSGQSCWRCNQRMGGADKYDAASFENFKCAAKDPCGLGQATKVENSGGLSTTFVQETPLTQAAISTNADGETVAGTIGLAGEYNSIEDLRAGLPKELEVADDIRSNSACQISEMQERYMANCYSCVVVSTLISTFMRVAELTTPVTQSAGTKLLILGMLIWIPVFILQKMASFVSIEPMKMLQELFTFFFKCLVAYVLITSGIRNVSRLIVNPILGAGADYGITMIDSVMPKTGAVNTNAAPKDNKSYAIAAGNGIDPKIFTKIMTISKKADAATSLNFVIGNALFCHSTHAGALVYSKKLTELLKIPFFIPDFWIMLCAALIWFFAFMVTMGVNFYLLDLSFKIGFALLALPVTIGLWPFNKFKDKFTMCIKIIVNAAGTFMFLGISTGISLVLISSALGGTDELITRIQNNDSAYVSRLFSITGVSFLLILFAFFYSHKLISETVSKLTDKFFESATSGMNSMHTMTTQTIDFVKKKLQEGASLVAGGVGAVAGKAATNMATKAARGVIDKIRGGGKDDE